MDKQRNAELNFLYLDEEYQKKNNKKNESKTRTNHKTKKSKKNKERADKMSAQEDRELFNFDNEIVIGVTKIPQKTNKENVKKRTTKKNKEKQSNNINQLNNKQKKKENGKSKKIKNKNNQKNSKQRKVKNKIIKQVVKWTILIGALIAAFIFFMMSPLFNISNIEVIGNDKISSDTIISLSKIKLGENIYKTSSKKIERNIKENAYIEEVSIKRNLPNKMVISVKERTASFMLEYANSYAYINNQGYILEITEEKLNVPIIIGYSTKDEDIKAGNRLCNEDLEKLETVLRIVESANGNEIGNLITRINIEDKQNYTLIMEEKKKTVYLGDASNLTTRMQYLKAILIGEEGVEGEIFVNGDLNQQNAFFRKKE